MPRHYPAQRPGRTCEQMLASEQVKDLGAELRLTPTASNRRRQRVATECSVRPRRGA